MGCYLTEQPGNDGTDRRRTAWYPRIQTGR